ncbi:DUF1002 domain-containing protein [Anaerococcus hydrogenalis]|uniref:DUF1002 domain-containing protein n=1 Tax=Anaerococcus hydrogenalis TaxID=33029 RepID=A0A2N6UGP4_9FIRM|nr:DUF1002 domain-containing protein [Anaerococcus hydrogenalis]MDK7695678.1 DUF1002 domain-containing protein [Anaerococcus hydrogenalis]MDK7697499.1 DUF1002 domain-containing protein [Anaerococcus hydrogenalis]MDK7708766.1 DUF1002 domain-containing protein [Anaerococcus hydrogenalis]PMC80799.1 DUF1002 domain-containing protein [Anaerococcus hydrogenalis]
MKKILKNKGILGLLFAIILTIPQTSKANENFDSTKESYMYGTGLNQNQIDQVKDKLGLTDDINMASVNGADCEKYLGYRANDYDMISSVSVKKLPKGSGIKVDIITPENISSITQSQYTNAAITSGITDAQIKVASPKVVTGESALVGVYKAIELSGEKVDTQSTQTAQEELGTLKKISDENQDNGSFDKDKLDQAVAEVKQNLKEYKDQNGSPADSKQIQIFIQDALKNVNMGDILSNNNIQILVNYFEKYQESPAIDSKNVEENLKKFAGNLTEKGKQFYQDNKEDIDKVGNDIKESGLWDKILQFFKDLFSSFTSSDNNNSNN